MSLRSFAILLAGLALTACREQAKDQHGAAPHEHATKAEAPERPGLSVTVYQSGLELFMEYPALVVGEESALVAHFTDARDPDGFKVVKTGRVTATLRDASGKETKFVAEKLLRDGIFKPVVKPTVAGDGSLSLLLEGEQVTGQIDVGKVTVYPNVAASAAAAEEEPAEKAHPFFKEQQWKTDYATAPAEVRVLQGGVRASGELKAPAGQAAELSAPVAGRIPVGEQVPALGQPVKKGELLVRIVPTAMAAGTNVATVELEANRARAELGLAERELARAQELVAAKALPEKQLDAAKVAKELAAARLSAAERQRETFRGAKTGGAGSGGGNAFELRSPLDGVVFFADVMPGATVEAGQRLVAVVNTQKLWLEARVFEADAPKVERAPGASFTVAGFEREFTVTEATGKRVAVGAVVDKATRTVPVIFELPNPEGALKPGMFARITLFTGETVRGVAVPEQAVVDDNGKPTVFVMDGGESFFKRAIRPGVRSGGWVQILDGLKEGDRVVSRGAFELKLSTATGAMPEHGHQH
jgi:membrane fusion protein, heavy metal efflux system